MAHVPFKKLFPAIFVLVVLALPASAFARSIWPAGYWGADLIPCGWGERSCTNLCQLVVLGDNLTALGITVALFAIAPIMIAWGGITIIIFGASSGGVQKGRSILTAAVIGTAIALGSYVIVSTFFKLLSVTVGARSGTGWSVIDCGP